MSLNRRIALAMLLGLLAAPATAQAPAGSPVKVRGTVDMISPNAIRVAAYDGKTLEAGLPASVRVQQVIPARLEDIKPGSYVGVASIPGRGGVQNALEVHIFPESDRGTGEGHRKFDLEPDSAMTNGTVGDVAQADGTSLRIKYAGGEQRINVPPGTPIVTYAPGNRDMLVHGARVILFGEKSPDGAISATRILVGKGDLTPPM